MELYIIFALLSAISFSVALIINKHILKNVVKNYFLFLFYMIILDVVFSLTIWLFVPMKIPSFAIVPYIFGTVIFYFAAAVVSNYTFSHGDISMLGPLMQTRVLFIVFLSFFLLGESFSIGTYLWITLMIFGGVVVSIDEKISIKSFFTSFMLIALFSNFLWAMVDILTKNVLVELDPWNANAWRMLLMGPMAILLLPKTKKEKMWIGPKRMIPVLVTFILAEIVGVGLILMAFSVGTVTLSNAFAMMRGPLIVVITILLSTINPDLLERHTKKVYLIRLVGSMIMLFAAIQLIV